MASTSIEWTDATWNPVRGCIKVSPGCTHCYAETFAERFRGVAGNAYEAGFTPRLAPEALGMPLHWRKPRRVFVNSMSDFFQQGRAGGPGIPWSYLAACFGVMALGGHHTFQLLTKGAAEMAAFVARCSLEAALHHLAHHTPGVPIPPRWGAHVGRVMKRQGRDLTSEAWPPPNVHLGVSVEDRRYGLPRIEVLRQVPAALRFLSCEPLLEDLGTLDLTGIGWVIVGGESDSLGRARGCRVEWIRSVVRQCRDQQVPVFVKQLGAKPIEGGQLVVLTSRKGNRLDELPVDLRVREFPREVGTHGP